jgi:hypothetical protein
VTGLLADRLALVLHDHGAMPCERLARVVAMRTAAVRTVLRDDPRFERVGSARSSRWRLVLPLDGVTDGRHNGSGRMRDGLGRIPSPEPRSTDGLDVAERLEALERGLRAVERRLAAEVPAA